MPEQVTFSLPPSTQFRWRRKTYCLTKSFFSVCQKHLGSCIYLSSVHRVGFKNLDVCCIIGLRRSLRYQQKEWLFFGPTLYDELKLAYERLDLEEALRNVAREAERVA